MPRILDPSQYAIVSWHERAVMPAWRTAFHRAIADELYCIGRIDDAAVDRACKIVLCRWQVSTMEEVA